MTKLSAEKLAEIRERLKAFKHWHLGSGSWDEGPGPDLEALLAHCDALEGELETERMRLVGCGVAALSNTPETASKQRISRDNPYWSASYGDVCASVDREMHHREERDAWKEYALKSMHVLRDITQQGCCGQMADRAVAWPTPGGEHE